MNGMRQGWLVARREIRERSRSKVFRAGIVITLALVIVAIVAAAKIHTGNVTRDVGFTGTTPAALPAAVIDQGKAVDVTVRPRYYGGVAAGEQAVRGQNVAVLVVDAHRLTWRGQPDEQLRAIVTAAIQLVTVQQRAAAAGIDPGQLHAVMAPVPVENQQLDVTAGRSTGNATAAIIMSALLLMAIVLYGNLVLTGVAEEKSSRVVEVLLARMPARNLLAGKVAGIGFLGFAQFAVTALAALIAALAVHPAGIPAVSGGVLAWVIVWFVLGYALYAMAYGALGSLASRAEDAANVAAPVSYALAAAYWVSLLVVARNPDSVWLEAGLPLPGHRTICHVRPHRHRRRRLVGARDRRRPHRCRHRRPGRARRARLHRRHPPHRTDPQAERRLERHNPARSKRGAAPRAPHGPAAAKPPSHEAVAVDLCWTDGPRSCHAGRAHWPNCPRDCRGRGRCRVTALRQPKAARGRTAVTPPAEPPTSLAASPDALSSLWLVSYDVPTRACYRSRS